MAMTLKMTTHQNGTIAVIFTSRRMPDDGGDYNLAASAMDALAAEQPGYCGIDSVRDAAGFGITVSYWASDADAKAWRDHPEHAAIRDQGREKWYRSYSLHVAQIERSYDWNRQN